MLLDHIGFKYDIYIFRCIGRLALPIYAYFIVNHLFKTKDISKYLVNILFIALLAQLPYWLYFKIFQLNICFTWVFCIVAIYFIKNRHKVITRIGLCIIIGCVSLIIPFEGCIFGWLWCCVWFFGIYEKDLENGKKDISLLMAAITCFAIIIFTLIYEVTFWCLSIFAIPIICIPLPKIRNKYFKKVYHYFYPLHLFLLLLLR